jgi:hypothetical protein
VKKFIAFLAFMGVALTLVAVYTPAIGQPKAKDAYSDFRACKPDERPFGDDVPPPRPLKSTVRDGYRFQWQINDKTGELLYRRLGKHGIK